jgi:endoglucanase
VIRRVGITFAMAVALTLTAETGWWIARAIAPRWRTADRRAANIHAAQAAGREFLDEQALQDGRVIRRDQGADAVSEGQAYAMLIAVGIDDHARFASVWS